MNEEFNSISVSDKLDETIKDSMRTVKRIHRKRVIRKACASTAVTFATALVICTVNPVLASNIPFIGKIFEKVEDQVTFSGNYKEKAKMLTTKTKENSVKNNGLEITAKEIYSDGISAYVTFRVKSEKGFGELSEYYSSVNGETTCAFLNVDGFWFVGSEGKRHAFNNEKFEGKQIDKYSFEGILKMDLFDAEEVVKGDAMLNISFTSFAASLKNEPISTKGYSFQSEGSWNLELPIKADESDVQRFTVNDVNKNGYGLKEVIITPFEVKVKAVAPKAGFSEKEWKDKYQGMKKKLISTGRKDYQDELNEIMKEWENRTVECGIAVFDQDGKRLEYENAVEVPNGEIDTYAVKGKKIKKLYIYIGTDWIDAVKEKNKDVMESKAVYKKEIILK